MITSGKTFLLTALLVSSTTLHTRFVQAMNDQSDYEELGLIERSEQEEEMTDLERMLKSLSPQEDPIQIEQIDYDFAQAYVSSLLEVIPFSSLNARGKEQFMEKFIGVVHGIMRTRMCCDENKPQIVMNMYNQIYESLRQDEEDDELKRRMQWAFSTINQNVRGQYVIDEERINAMFIFCDRACDQLTHYPKKLLLAVCKHFYDTNQLELSTIHAILIELISQCDEEFKKQDQVFKESLSLMDLFGEWRRVCGLPLTEVQRASLAITGAQDLSLCFPRAAGASFLAVWIYGLLYIPWIGYMANSHGDWRTPSVIDACIVAFVLAVMISENCAHYWANKQL